MKNIQFPVQLIFKISTLSNDFTALDANGQTIAYVRQKMFKFKEDISVFADDSKSTLAYTIKADRWIDFNAAYAIKDAQDKEIGKIGRKGWRSLWKSQYDIIDQHQKPQFQINEENAWVKVWDSLVGEVPIIGMFTGYFFNPSYLVTDTEGRPVFRLRKEPSFFGRKFIVTKLGEADADDGERIILGLMMMVLLERRKG